MYGDLDFRPRWGLRLALVCMALAVGPACDGGDKGSSSGTKPTKTPDAGDDGEHPGTDGTSSDEDSGEPTAGTVELKATSSKVVYAAGERVVIRIEITNGTDEAIALSNKVAGTLIVDSLARDGAEVEPRGTIVKFDEAFDVLLTTSLQTVDPGESVTMIARREAPGTARSPGARSIA